MKFLASTKLLFFILSSLFILSVVAIAEEERLYIPNVKHPGGLAVETTSITAIVDQIDYKKRQVTLKKENGEIFSLVVGPQARNFDQTKIGDKVTFKYFEALAVDVRKVEEELSATSDRVLARAPLGSKPAGVMAETISLSALVEDIDYSARLVTLKGPEGNSLTLKVGEQAKKFNEVKKGDRVAVTYTEALGISVTSPE
jgi:hypothetical protein